MMNGNKDERHQSRRDFLKALAASTLVLSSGFFLGGKLAVAREIASALGACSHSYECAGGGGECGTGYNCAGQGAKGKGKCGSGYDCFSV